MPRYIKVSDLQRKMASLSDEMRRCKNTKLLNTLKDEHFAYAITLRNVKQHEMPRPTVTVKEVRNDPQAL